MSGTATDIDPIRLEVIWNRLISIVDEQAAALMNASFTTVVREAGDLSAGLFDTQGRMLAQAATGTPGHINSMATAAKHFLERFPPASYRPGDHLITNDPWMVSGHLNDVTLFSPCFYRGRPVAFFASTCHTCDFGGRPLGAEARDVYEEGFSIPVLKFMEAGEPNRILETLIRANVRMPDEVIGDIYAQVAANEVGGAKLLQFLEEAGLDSIDPIGEVILERSETAMRSAVRDIPEGVYPGEVMADGFDEAIRLAVTLAVRDGGIHADFKGTSPQSAWGINVVPNYAYAYCAYTVKCSVGSQIPNNEGSFRPITMSAPQGCILNPKHPAPVGARHILGHFVAAAIFDALSKAVPGRVLAEGATGLWLTQLAGTDRKDKTFSYIFFSSGGTGARPTSDGLSATAFPSGVQGTPVEIMENVLPLLFTRKELRRDSGGPGRFRGGLGQSIGLKPRTAAPIHHSPMYDRFYHPAQGAAGGLEGEAGSLVLSTGERLHSKKKYKLPPDVEVTLNLPGGGGFYSPLERDPERVRGDVLNEYVSREAAERFYGVILNDDLTVDWGATEKRRKGN
ncbi:MAG: hydantoinase B/oxoprolinase family protein [Candidatus Tectomicrobia bacterium]|nr:hydantoinase B/oxoprolinase family protein [Candidatus Tectomicrobia bacterium]